MSSNTDDGKICIRFQSIRLGSGAMPAANFLSKMATILLPCFVIETWEA